MSSWPPLVLYSKPGCHLCEGLEAKLIQIEGLAEQLQRRDISTQAQWWERYQYEIPVLCWLAGEQEYPLPRCSPRASVQQIQRRLLKGLQDQGWAGAEDFGTTK